jgi:hypothetical protein
MASHGSTSFGASIFDYRVQISGATGVHLLICAELVLKDLSNN